MLRDPPEYQAIINFTIRVSRQDIANSSSTLGGNGQGGTVRISLWDRNEKCMAEWLKGEALH
jgi:hypothetical protein